MVSSRQSALNLLPDGYTPPPDSRKENHAEKSMRRRVVSLSQPLLGV
jgi:hypothetical protein